MDNLVDTLIIGAGPYGLSLAAHLRASGHPHRIVGRAMQSWIANMPSNMRLKSEGFASSLSEPTDQFTLGAYCAAKGIPYRDTGLPVEIKTFTEYGQEFQRRFVPHLEETAAVSVQRMPGGFRIELKNGQTMTTRRVVVASGIVPYAWLPQELASLDQSVCSHSSRYTDMTQFAGQKVAVIGAGSSAMDLAALLKQKNADVTVIARRPVVNFQTPLGSRGLVEKLRAPMTSIGPGWKSVLCTKAPLLFHFMPEAFRVDVVRRYLGPAPAWFTREAVEGRVPVLTGAKIEKATTSGGKVLLQMSLGEHGVRTISVDHVIAATGYKVDVDKLAFLDSDIRRALRRDDKAPRLSLNFESSIPGLYFIGTSAANSFGPMLRFACGSGFAARRVARYLKATKTATLAAPDAFPESKALSSEA